MKLVENRLKNITKRLFGAASIQERLIIARIRYVTSIKVRKTCGRIFFFTANFDPSCNFRHFPQNVNDEIVIHGPISSAMVDFTIAKIVFFYFKTRLIENYLRS